MNITPISFKGTYYINRPSLDIKTTMAIRKKEYAYGLDIFQGGYRNFENLYINCPEEKDKKVQKLLSKLKIPYQQIDEVQAVDIQNILSRVVLSNEAQNLNYSIKLVDTAKLDKELRKNQSTYIAYGGKNGISEKYKGFINFLKSNQPIEAPIIYFSKKSGITETNVHDGRHRIAVFRDLGMPYTPIAMNDKSVEIAKEIGLL